MSTRLRKHLQTVQGGRGLQAARLLEAEGPAATGAPDVHLASLRLGPSRWVQGRGQLHGGLRGEGRPALQGGREPGSRGLSRLPPGGRSELLARLPTARQYHLQGWMTPRAAATPTVGRLRAQREAAGPGARHGGGVAG